MPTMLPTRTPTKPVPQTASTTPSLIDLSALGVGVVAASLAGFVYLGTGDHIGTTLILLLAAVVVLAMLRASADALIED